MLLEPLHGLQKSILLGIQADPVLWISADREAVLDTAVQVDLVWQAEVLEDLLGLVALLGREDGIGLGGGDGQWAFHVAQLVALDERRVRRVSGVDLAGVRTQVSDYVFAAEAVAHGADFLASIFRPHLDQTRVDDRIDHGRQVCDLFLIILSLYPLHDVKVARSVEWDGVAMEQVGHHDKVAVGRELVGDELCVDEAVADDVGDNQDTLLCTLVLGVFGVDFKVAQRRDLAGGVAFVLDALVAAFSRWIGCHG